jgi:hypothetical protein
MLTQRVFNPKRLSAGEILVEGLKWQNSGMLTQYLISLELMLTLHGQRHFAYPVIH